jgi:hypothetical protein
MFEVGVACDEHFYSLRDNPMYKYYYNIPKEFNLPWRPKSTIL